jgi:hypothetical protein
MMRALPFVSGESEIFVCSLFVEIELNLRQPGGNFRIPLVFYFHVAHFSPLPFILPMWVNSVASLAFHLPTTS